MDVLPPKRTNIYYVRDRHTRRLQLSGKQTHALDKATEIDPIDCKIVPGLESGESTWHAASFIAGHIAFGIVCLVVCTPCLSVCLSVYLSVWEVQLGSWTFVKHKCQWGKGWPRSTTNKEQQGFIDEGGKTTNERERVRESEKYQHRLTILDSWQ